MIEYTIFEVLLYTFCFGVFNVLDMRFLKGNNWKKSIWIGIIAFFYFFLLLLILNYLNAFEIKNL